MVEEEKHNPETPAEEKKETPVVEVNKEENKIVVKGVKTDPAANIPVTEITIEKEDPNGPSYDTRIEEARSNLSAMYKKSRRNSNIFMVIAVAVMIAGMILIAQTVQPYVGIGWGCMGVALAILVVHYFLTKNKFPNATKVYIEDISQMLNSHIFTKTEFSDVKTDPKEKMAQSDILADGVYGAISNIGSRNVVTGLYRNHGFKIADLAVYKAGKRRDNPELIFIGKYISYPNDLHFEGRYVFTIFNPKVETVMENKQAKEKVLKVDQPNAVDDLSLLKELNDFKVFGPEGTDFEAAVSQHFSAFLQNLHVDQTLLNINIVVWAGHTACYYSYGDEVIGLPFEKPFSAGPMEHYKQDLENLLEGLNLIVKK